MEMGWATACLVVGGDEQVAAFWPLCGVHIEVFLRCLRLGDRRLDFYTDAIKNDIRRL
jgi:hypothetical protein